MKGRVLVVDDDLALAEMLGIVLRNEGLEVTHVADGSEAVGVFRESRPTSCCSTSCSRGSTAWRCADASGPRAACPSSC